ncbi:hypothetical protein SAMD00023353_0601500 [Rosellinia necatrix]|uniref:Uncharacterized protein n=1 Tax=Rosellinia necatrix TaxID=77044 RepID=A0A1S7UNX5_ROSNE|nr:hypothetical protein SAMD00023353_0601500 [Rosellinia necatrix]
MRASFILALLPATGAFAATLPRQEGGAPSDVPTATATSSPEIPCPTAPASCASRLNGHLVCLNSRTWCLYTDTTRYTPGFFPVDLENACAPCLTII